MVDPQDQTPSQRSDPQRQAIFEQFFAQYRHLNEQMNKIPTLAVTLTGGFWYVAVIVKDYGDGLSAETQALARFALMIFAGIANIALILIATRIRGVMSGYQDKLQAYAGSDWPSSFNQKLFFNRVDYSMISIYVSLMLAGAVLSIVGAFLLHWEATGLNIWKGIVGFAAALVLLFFFSWGLPKWLTRSNI